MNPGEDPRRASLMTALDAVWTALGRLRLDDRRRPDLVRRYRAIEQAIDDLGDAP